MYAYFAGGLYTPRDAGLLVPVMLGSSAEVLDLLVAYTLEPPHKSAFLLAFPRPRASNLLDVQVEQGSRTRADIPIHVVDLLFFVYCCSFLMQKLLARRAQEPMGRPRMSLYFPDEKDTTAHLPLQAHFLAPESPPPPSMAFNSSSWPGFRPTTTSALQVRRAKTLSPEPGPSGPIASVNGVAASHCACYLNVSSYFDVTRHVKLTSPVSFR